MSELGYDIIGDIHGQFKKVCSLLQHMGYTHSDGVYSHPRRKAIFLGDLIDRGPQQRAVIELVMNMVQGGNALVVMGNHEYNLVALHSEDPEFPGHWLRPRTDKNLAQHLAFHHEYLSREGINDLPGVIEFFKSLPLWLDLPGLRVIHACWDPGAMAALHPFLDDHQRLTEPGWTATSRSGSVAFESLEILLKGPEVNLPNGVVFIDKGGVERTKMRLRWWYEDGQNLADQVQDKLNATSGLQQLPTVPVLGYPAGEPPLFIGHYWFKGVPGLIKANMACLDYSAARKGPLIAYRWSGEQRLVPENLCYLPV